MAGLMDFLGGMGGMFGGTGAYDDLLTPEQKKAMQQQTMMTMAAKLLQAGGPSTTPTNLGQALGGAFLTGQEAYSQAGQNAVQQMLAKQKIDEYRLKNKYLKAIQGPQAEAAEAPAAGPITADQAIAAAGMPVGPTTQRAAMIGQKPAVKPMSERDKRYNDMMNKYDIATRYGMVDDAAKYFEQAMKLKPIPKVTGQPFEATDPSGKTVMVQQYDDGTFQTMEGFGPKRNITFQNVGDKLVAVDMANLAPGAQLQMGMDPSSAANLALSRQRFTADQATNLRDFQYRQQQDLLANQRAGEQLAINKQTAASNAGGTVEERKAAMFVGRLEGARKVFEKPVMGPDGKPMVGPDGKPVTIEDAFGKPGVMETLFSVAPFGENLANQARSAGRQQYRQAQEDWVTAVMRPESGAVIGPDEMQAKIVTFFPQIGDSPEVIEQKRLAREESERGLKIMAGRALGAQSTNVEYDWVDGKLVPRTK